MLAHYLRIALRSFRRHPWYSLVNIGCLAIGLAAVMTVLLYILHEHSYDRWHANSKRIVAVYTTSSFGKERFTSNSASYPVGPAGKAADPNVESMVRARYANGPVDLQNPASPAARFRESSGFLFADSNFFHFFSFRLLHGNPGNVLARPFSVVLTRSAARKYFGESDPVGKTLVLDKRYPMEVTGVAADMPSNTSLVFDFVASLATLRHIDEYKADLSTDQLQSGAFLTWFLLTGIQDTAGLARNLSQVAMLAAEKKATAGVRSAGVETHQFSLLPLGDTHLKGAPGHSSPYLTAFAWAGALLMLLAMVNYMSLVTARSTARAHEVGVRKVIGARWGRIAQQFYVESTLHAALAFASGLLLFLAFRPVFCGMMRITIDTQFLITPVTIGAFAGLLLLVVVLAGSYPSLLLASFRPVAVLYGKWSRQRSGERIRKGFLVFQFTLSMVLMSAAIVVAKELYYLRHTETGVERENIAMFPYDVTLKDLAGYRSELSRIPGIRALSATRNELYGGYLFLTLVQLPGRSAPEDLMMITVDSSFIPMLGLKWKEAPAPGANWLGFDHMVLNEAAVESFQWAGRATGNHFFMDRERVTVSGVLRDFNFQSLHERIQPLGLQVVSDRDSVWAKGLDGVLYAKIAPHVNVPSLIVAVHRIYSRYDDQTAFEYTFLDDEFNKQYQAEDRLAELMDLFTAITIFIASMGLFALATFAAQQRLKEIGIRKVLGASVASINGLLTRDFLRPILLSVVIASPMAWWVMHGWLQNFAYRTPIGWWVFVATGGGLLLLALGTVVVRTIRAAQIKPTINLRTE